MKRSVNALLLCAGLCMGAFAQNASDFKTDGKGTITGYDGWDNVITIPAQIGGTAVTAIGDSAFIRMGITGITLPTGIKRIGNDAFRGNKLASLSLPAGVTVGNNAFMGNQLTSLTAGNGVSIGSEAFRDNKLTSFTMGNGGFIADNAFQGNNNLKTLTLGADITFGRSAFSISVYYDYMSNKKKAGTYDNTANYPGKKEGDYEFVLTKYGAVITLYTNNEGSRLDIPARLGGAAVTGIGGNKDWEWRGAFQGKIVSRMRLPDGIAFIDDRAFCDNRLTSVTIPDSVISIGSSAFYVNKLTSVTIGNSVISIGASAFAGNDHSNGNQLTSVTIPDSVTSIGEWAFYRNQLTSVTIPDSVTTIGERAFYLNQLTSVTIGANVTVGSDNEFDGAYKNDGKLAGTYTRPNTYDTWTRQ